MCCISKARSIRLYRGTKMKNHDIVIAGAGLSGLSLAWHIVKEHGDRYSILVAGNTPEGNSRRTFGFWANGSFGHEDIISRSYKNMRIAGSTFNKQIFLKDYSYNVIHGKDFFTKMRTQLDKAPSVRFLPGHIKAVSQQEDLGTVLTENGTVRGRLVFDSTGLALPKKPHTGLFMSFKGLFIETKSPVFTPGCLNFLDFRMPADDGLRFMYVLPFTKRTALVEHTSFVTADKTRNDSVEKITAYMSKIFDCTDWKVRETEAGFLPLKAQFGPRQLSKNIVMIGNAGGMLKASAGYAFSRVQKDSRKIAGLMNNGLDIMVNRGSMFYRLVDSLMVKVMTHYGGEVPGIFRYMFERNSINTVFRFLDEELAFTDCIRLIKTLPPSCFLRSLVPVPA